MPRQVSDVDQKKTSLTDGDKKTKKPVLTAAERKEAKAEKEKLERLERRKEKGILKPSTYTGTARPTNTSGTLAKRAEKRGIAGAIGSIFARKPVEKEEKTAIVYKLHDTCIGPEGFFADESFSDKKVVHAASRYQDPKTASCSKVEKVVNAIRSKIPMKKDSSVKSKVDMNSQAIGKDNKNATPAVMKVATKTAVAKVESIKKKVGANANVEVKSTIAKASVPPGNVTKPETGKKVTNVAEPVKEKASKDFSAVIRATAETSESHADEDAIATKPKVAKQVVDEDIVMSNTDTDTSSSNKSSTAPSSITADQGVAWAENLVKNMTPEDHAIWAANLQNSLNPEGDINVLALDKDAFSDLVEKAVVRIRAKYAGMNAAERAAAAAEILQQSEKIEVVDKMDIVEESDKTKTGKTKRARPVSMVLLEKPVAPKKSKANLRASAREESDSDNEPIPRKVFAAKKSKRFKKTPPPQAKTAAGIAL